MDVFKPQWNKNKALSYIDELSYAFQKSRTLFAAMQFDIFTLIGDRHLSSDDIAEQLNLDKRATDRLLNALTSLGLLNKKDFNFSNTESSKTFLVKGSPDYLGNMEHLSTLWENWGGLSDAVKTGEPVNYEPIKEKNDEWLEAYISSNHWKASVEASDVIKHINLRDVNKVLDLGGGSGKYAVEFVRAKPDINAVVFDYPRVIEYASEYVGKSGLSDKISTIGGNVLTDDIGSGYDLIFISYVLQDYSIWDNVSILQKAYDALKVNGQCVVHEKIINDDRSSPEKAVLHSLNMLINTKAGDCYTETDIWIMMKEAWLKDIQRYDTDFESSLMTGIR